MLSLSDRYFYAVAEIERRKRGNINKLLSVFVNDVDSFRLLMQETGGVLVGQLELAETFFSELAPAGNKVELFSPDMDRLYSKALVLFLYKRARGFESDVIYDL